MSDEAKTFWSIVIGGLGWVLLLYAAIYFPGCANPKEEEAPLVGHFVRLQCFLPSGNVTATLPMERFVTRFKFQNLPCIFEGIDEAPKATASPDPRMTPTNTATPERIKRK